MQRTIVLIIGLVIFGAIVGFFTITALLQDEPKDFVQCKAKGYPIQETFPEVCHTPSGQSFTNK